MDNELTEVWIFAIGCPSWVVNTLGFNRMYTAYEQRCRPKIVRRGLFTETFSTTPITIAAFRVMPFSCLSMPKVNINAIDNNRLKLWLKWK